MQAKKTKPEKNEAIEVVCPKCQYTAIIYMPKEDMSKCPECDIRMVIKELLREGKSF